MANQTKQQSSGCLVTTLIGLFSVLYVLALIAHLILRAVVGDEVWWVALLNNLTPYFFLPLILIFVFAILFRWRRMIFLSVILLVTGGLLYLPRFLPRSVEPMDGTAIRVLTYNIFPDNRQLTDDIGWIRTQEADIILLQEINPLRATEVINAVSVFSASHPYRSYQAGDVGNLIISAFPIIEEQNGNNDQQRVVLDILGQEVVVFNVHFPMPINPEAPTVDLSEFDLPDLEVPGAPAVILSYSPEQRDILVRDWLEDINTEELPIIAAGDFNLSDQSQPYRDIGAKLQDAYLETSVGLGATWQAGDAEEFEAFLPPLFRLDYVWHTEELQAVGSALSEPMGSDHLALVVDLMLLQTDE